MTIDENIISALNPIVTPIQVRYSDTDAMGHINNAVYHVYLECCRIGFMDALNLPKRSDDSRPPIIMARTEMDFLKPGFVGDMIAVSGWLTAAGNKSFTMRFSIDAEERGCLARAVGVQVWYDYAAERSVPIPDEVRTLFERLIESGNTSSM